MAKDPKERALRYALSLVVFQEVGVGDDRNLGDVRNIVDSIRWVCKEETGVELSGYPTDYLNENLKELIELLPYGLKKELGKEKLNQEMKGGIKKT